MKFANLVIALFNRARYDYRSHWNAPKEVPYIRIGHYKLWGASYRILEPILTELSNEQLQS